MARTRSLLLPPIVVARPMKVSWPRSWDMDLTFHASAKDVVSHYEQVGHPRLALRLFDANGRRLEFVTDGKTWPPWRTHRGTSQAVRLRKHILTAPTN